MTDKNKGMNQDKKQPQPMKQDDQKNKAVEKQDVGNESFDTDEDLDEQGEITQRNPRQGQSAPDTERE